MGQEFVRIFAILNNLINYSMGVKPKIKLLNKNF